MTPPPPPEPFSGQLELMAQDLDLSPEQYASIREIALDGHRRSIGFEGELRLAELDLETLLERESPDLNAVKESFDQVADGRSRLAWNQLQTRLEIRRNLNQKQRQKLRERTLPKPHHPPGVGAR